jgi:hypothetical protein
VIRVAAERAQGRHRTVGAHDLDPGGLGLQLQHHPGQAPIGKVDSRSEQAWGGTEGLRFSSAKRHPTHQRGHLVARSHLTHEAEIHDGLAIGSPGGPPRPWVPAQPARRRFVRDLGDPSGGPLQNKDVALAAVPVGDERHPGAVGGE